MGTKLCGCDNDPGPSTEANLVKIYFLIINLFLGQ